MPDSQPEVQESVLQEIRDLSPLLLKAAVTLLIPAGLMAPEAFWTELTDSQATIGYRACLLLWMVSNCKLVPRQFQLEATIATLEGRDSVIDVGTGYGKTLCLVLPCLLDPKSVSIVITPLKRLQAVQVLEVARYGIEALAINEDTPRSPELWQRMRTGQYKLLLVQPEQLSTIDGHVPRMARLVDDRRFTSLVKRVHVDEAHTIYSAGLEHYGLPAFRPAWGRLGDFRLKLPKNITFQALSGTQPKHIKATITERLLLNEKNALFVKLSSNRPNTIYATHAIVGELKDLRNLDFLVPDKFYPPMRLAKTLIFHDNTEEAADAALHTNNRLPLAFRHQGLVRHYHSGMSLEYLTQVYNDFCDPDGNCVILHATEGASTGLDIRDIDAVVQYGLNREMPTALQRGGRGGRNPHRDALFLIMYEPWALEINLKPLLDNTDHWKDPDRPVGQLTKFSTKIARAGAAMLHLVQSPECMRQIFATYLSDESPDALKHTTPWCCSRHPGSGFHIRHYFNGKFLYQDSNGPGKLYYGDANDPGRVLIVPKPKDLKRGRGSSNRAVIERAPLIYLLQGWRVQAHLDDPLQHVRPASFILDDESITAIAKIHPSKLKNSLDSNLSLITEVLKETPAWVDEWAKKILTVVQKYDAESKFQSNKKAQPLDSITIGIRPAKIVRLDQGDDNKENRCGLKLL